MPILLLVRTSYADSSLRLSHYIVPNHTHMETYESRRYPLRNFRTHSCLLLSYNPSFYEISFALYKLTE